MKGETLNEDKKAGGQVETKKVKEKDLQTEKQTKDDVKAGKGKKEKERRAVEDTGGEAKAETKDGTQAEDMQVPFVEDLVSDEEKENETRGAFKDCGWN